MIPIFTKLLEDKRSNLCQHMKTTYPDTLALRQLIREAAGNILVQSGPAHAGTLGTAFDILSGFLLVDGHVPLNPAPSPVWRPVHALIAQRLTEYAHADLNDRATNDDFYRYVWVLAELASIARTGQLNPDGALATVLRGEPGMDALLSITPDDGIRQLREMETVATEHLYPYVHQPRASATFASASHLVQAEADLIADGLLLDYKTTAGTVHRGTGARSYFPKDADIYQILGYALMDLDDEYGIDSVGLYAARFGHSSVWPLPQLLGITAGGHAVGLDRARRDFRAALEADAAAGLVHLSGGA